MRAFVSAYRWVTAFLWLGGAGFVFFSNWQPPRWLIGIAFIATGLGLIVQLLEERS